MPTAGPQSSTLPLRCRVVIADADAGASELLTLHLERRGFDVTRMREPGRAFRVWNELRADVLVVSIDDHEIEALELLTALAGRPDRPTTIATTRRAGTAVLGHAAQEALGIDRVLPRPCRLRDVEQAIVDALAERRDVAAPRPSQPAIPVVRV